jgi:hypothetical protein
MSRSYTSSPPNAYMVCSVTALLIYYANVTLERVVKDSQNISQLPYLYVSEKGDAWSLSEDVTVV